MPIDPLVIVAALAAAAFVMGVFGVIGLLCGLSERVGDLECRVMRLEAQLDEGDDADASYVGLMLNDWRAWSDERNSN